MKSLNPPLIEPESGPPKPPWPIEAEAAAADPPDDFDAEEEEAAVDVPVELPLEAELLPNRFEDVPRKPPLEDADPPDAEEPPADDELESDAPVVRPAVAEAGELVEEELDEDPLDPPEPPEEPPLSPPPPPPPEEETCTVIRPPPPDTETLTEPPRPPRSCGTMSDENLSGTVDPVNLIVCCIRSLVADTVRSDTGAPPPGPPVEG